MPQAVLGTVALAAFNAGAPLAVANAIVGVGVAGALLHTTVAVGALLAANAALNRPQVPRPSDGQVEFKQAIPPRMWHYGRVKVSGPLAFYEIAETAALTAEWGVNFGGTLVKIVLLSARELDAIEDLYLDDVEVTFDADGYSVSSAHVQALHFHVRIWTYLGTDAQTADPFMLDAFTGDWTSAHRLRGIAYAVVAMDSPDEPPDMQDAYPQGEPQLKALVRGAKLYDPRLDSTVTGGAGAHRHNNKATWEWSDNAALAILDYLTHEDGYNRPVDEFDLQSFQALADICDENVTLKAGGTENRYRIATTVYLTEKRKDVLRRLLEACDAELYPTADGTWAIRGGEYNAPTVVLDADQGHLIEAQFSAGRGAIERYNELAIQYMSPVHGYGEVEGDPWQNATDPDFVDGIVETRPLDLLQVPSHGQARRLAKIRMSRDNPEWVAELRTNFFGLDCIGERLVTIKWPELEIDGPFWIDGLSVNGDGTGARMTVRSAVAASYNWTAATEEGDAPPVPPEV